MIKSPLAEAVCQQLEGNEEHALLGRQSGDEARKWTV